MIRSALKVCIPILLLASGAAFAQEAATTPTFKLLYTAPQTFLAAEPITLVETSVGTFNGLSIAQNNAFGASIFSMDYFGNVQNVYTAPPFFYIAAFVQALDGRFYGPGWYMQSSLNYQYISVDLTGSAQSYKTAPWIPGSWSLTSPAGLIYNFVSASVGGAFVFAQIGLHGVITPLHQFSGSDGFPYGGTNLVQGQDGNIYSIAFKSLSGISTGWLYRMTPQGQYTKVVSLPVAGAGGLAAPIVAASDGNIYGAFPRGGATQTGMIYKVAADGTYQKLLDFPATGMTQPAFLVEGSDGNLYGSTDGGPSYLFQVNLKTLKLTRLHKFQPNEGLCSCSLVQGMDGKLYGASPLGGLYGLGTIFSLDIGLPKPKPFVSSFSPTTGATGQPILLWGRNLLGASSVSFNGVAAATITVNSTQAVYVDVPSGATSGPITITTPNGTFTTTTSFQVP